MRLMQKLFRKRLSADIDGQTLKPVLNAWDLTLLGIGGIIGIGIFVLPGIAAATQAGPGVVISFIVAGFACACAALAYAELAASVGGCGSAYGYSYAAFGEIIAWIIGWDLILEYGVGLAAVATGWSGYLKNALTAINMPLPEAFTAGPMAGGIVNLPALLIVLFLMGVLLAGIKNSARLNNVIVFIKLFAIAVFIVVAAQHVNPALWHPFMPFGWFSTTADGHTVGVLAAASVVFFAYIGFDAVSIAVEETINPQKNVPIGILASLAVCTVLYIVVSALLTGIVSYKELNVASPVAHSLLLLGINWATALIGAAVIAGLTTVMMVLFYGLTRVIFAMSRDGLLPGFMGRVHEKTQVPVNATLLCGVLIAAAAGFVPLGVLAELVNIGTLAAFVLVCGGVVMMRVKHPAMPRPFKSPLGLTFPILGMISCAILIGFLPLMTHIRFIVWLAVGAVFYFAYSIRKSKLQT
jgi:APA family basic amino acid/polyamine antiporter